MGEGNYSDAHLFPYAYKNNGIGKLVGMPVPGTGTAVWWETQIDPTIVFGIPMIAVIGKREPPGGKFAAGTGYPGAFDIRGIPIRKGSAGGSGSEGVDEKIEIENKQEGLRNFRGHSCLHRYFNHVALRVQHHGLIIAIAGCAGMSHDPVPV